MKRNLISMLFIGLFIVIFFNTIQAKDIVRSAGIGLRGTYWKISDSSQKFLVQTNPDYTEVNIGGGGGWLYFLTRMNEKWLAELSLGAVGQVETKVARWDGEDVHVSAATPILLGFRNEIFKTRNQSPIQPYLCFGAGPYWFSEVYAREDYFGIEEEASVKTNVKPGGYLGGGINFMMSNWFGLNFDLKYHFINFDVKHERSGYEYGIGLVFMWGKYDHE